MRVIVLLFLSFFLFHCSKDQEKSSQLKNLQQNPQSPAPEAYKMDSSPILIQGARIMTATGNTFEKADLLMEKGMIRKISETPIEPKQGTEVIDGTGLTLTPGLIDVHSHMGVYPSPAVDAHMDGNEMITANTAHVWAEHGFWPQDPDLWRALAGGVTTIQVLPGSGNLIGGRTFVAKLIPQVSAREMRFPGAKQGLKMACGENPKRVYEKKELMTRMGNVAAYRKFYQKALEYSRKWQAWNEDPKKDPSKMPERDLTMETLSKVLQGEILIHFHCYRADDIAAILDVAKEFGFKIRMVHHGLEAYKLADRLAKEEVAVATWADWWGFKAEAYDGIPYNVALLEKAGGRPVVHSDSAVDVRFLNVEAGKALSAARKLGLNFSEEQALAWITKNAAWALGLEKQIGTLETGKMADVVAWDGHPFSVYSKAQYVFINGQKVFDRQKKLKIQSDFEVGLQNLAFHDGREFSQPPLTPKMAWSESALESPEPVNDSFLIERVSAFLQGQWQDDVTIWVEKGNIKAINPLNAPGSLPKINAQGKKLTAGLIEADSDLGLVDIELDSKAQDLRTKNSLPTPDYRAVESLNTRNARLANVRQEGILTSLSSLGSQMASSMGVAFDLVTDGVVNPNVALYGQVTKGGSMTHSRSRIWSDLRQFLDDALLYQSNPKDYNEGDARPTVVNSRHLQAMQPILSGKTPWVVEVHRASDIANLIALKKQYKNLNLVLNGGTEAWLVADQLKKSNIPVILTPSLQTPQDFDKLQARFDQAAYLANAGVTVILTDINGYGFGRIRQEAGLAVKYGMGPEQALLAITENPGKVFGLNRGKIAPGTPANLVLWNGDPLEPATWAERIWIGGQEQSLRNRHRALAEKYLGE